MLVTSLLRVHPGCICSRTQHMRWLCLLVFTLLISCTDKDTVSPDLCLTLLRSSLPSLWKETETVITSRHHLWPHLPPRDGQTDLNIYIDTNTGSGIWSMLALGLIGCFVSTLLVWSVLNCVKHFFLWKIKKHTSIIICEKCANLFVLTVMWIVFIACSTLKQQWLSQSALEAGTKRNC